MIMLDKILSSTTFSPSCVYLSSLYIIKVYLIFSFYLYFLAIPCHISLFFISHLLIFIIHIFLYIFLSCKYVFLSMVILSSHKYYLVSFNTSFKFPTKLSLLQSFHDRLFWVLKWRGLFLYLKRIFIWGTPNSSRYKRLVEVISSTNE